jgi:adenine deaminase
VNGLPAFDLVIAGARVIDTQVGLERRADVGISADRIAGRPA